MPVCFNSQNLATYFPTGMGYGIDKYFTALCVIGSRDETAVIQWTTNDKIIHIAVVKLCNEVYETVAVFRPDVPDIHCIYEAIISPGQNQFLLRPSPVLCHRLMKDKYTSLPNNCARVVNIDLGRQRCTNSYEEAQSRAHNFVTCWYQTDLFAGYANKIAYAYDPRFASNRIAKVTS